MSDVTFQFGVVPNRYQDVVQRAAVLYQLRGVSRDSQDVRGKTTELLDQWRARIGSLTAAGWDPSASGTNRYSILYVRNCKPSFAITGHRTRCCTRQTICPWCYARWVRKVWMVIDADFPAPDQLPANPDEVEAGHEFRAITLDEESIEPVRRHSTTFRYRMIERCHEFVRPVLPTEDSISTTIPQQLHTLLTGVAESRGRLVELVNPVGAFLYTTLEPTADATAWKITHRQLFKMQQGHDLPVELAAATNGYINRYDRPTRREIMQTVARVCRYPAGLMAGDADRTVQLLTAARDMRFKSNAFYRSFRSVTRYE